MFAPWESEINLRMVINLLLSMNLRDTEEITRTILSVKNGEVTLAPACAKIWYRNGVWSVGGYSEYDVKVVRDITQSVEHHGVSVVWRMLQSSLEEKEIHQATMQAEWVEAQYQYEQDMNFFNNQQDEIEEEEAYLDWYCSFTNEPGFVAHSKNHQVEMRSNWRNHNKGEGHDSKPRWNRYITTW